MAKLLPVLVFLVAAFLLYVFFFSSLFKVKNISIEPNQNCLLEETIREKVESKNLILLNQGELASQLKNKTPCLKEITFKKSFPQKLTVNVKADEVLLKIDGSDLYLTDKGLTVKSQGAKTPTIFIPFSLP